MLVDLERIRNCSITLFERRGLPLAAKDAFAQWYKLAEERGLYEDQIQALLMAGLNRLQMKQSDAALGHFEQALNLIDMLGESDHVSRSHALFDLALAHDQQGDIDQALHYAKEVWEQTERGANLRSDAQVALLLGKLHIARESWPDAYRYSREALSCFEQLNDENGRSRALNNLGLICVETGDYDQAEALLQEALLKKQVLNDKSGSVYTLTELGRLHYKKGDLVSAVRFSRSALQTLWESVAFMDKAEVARLCRLFGSVASKTGDRQSAMGYLQRAITYYAQLGQWREWSAVTRELDELIRSDSSVNVARVSIEWHDKETLRNLTTLLGLMDTLEGLYPELRGKSELVTKYALLLGDACGVTANTRESLSHAARLANIGATFPDIDWEARGQEARGAHLAEKVLSMVSVSDECRVAVRHQYERYDGSGYPDGLQGAEIPLISRILAIVDAYVTQASSRQTENQPHSDAMRYLHKHAGTQFDLELVDAFSQMHEVEDVVG